MGFSDGVRLLGLNDQQPNVYAYAHFEGYTLLNGVLTRDLIHSTVSDGIDKGSLWW